MAEGGAFNPQSSMLQANPGVTITEFRGGGFAVAGAGADYSSVNGVDAGGEYTAVGGKIEISQSFTGDDSYKIPFLRHIGLIGNMRGINNGPYNKFLELFRDTENLKLVKTAAEFFPAASIAAAAAAAAAAAPAGSAAATTPFGLAPAPAAAPAAATAAATAAMEGFDAAAEAATASAAAAGADPAAQAAAALRAFFATTTTAAAAAAEAAPDAPEDIAAAAAVQATSAKLKLTPVQRRQALRTARQARSLVPAAMEALQQAPSISDTDRKEQSTLFSGDVLPPELSGMLFRKLPEILDDKEKAELFAKIFNDLTTFIFTTESASFTEEVTKDFFTILSYSDAVDRIIENIRAYTPPESVTPEQQQYIDLLNVTSIINNLALKLLQHSKDDVIKFVKYTIQRLLTNIERPLFGDMYDIYTLNDCFATLNSIFSKWNPTEDEYKTLKVAYETLNSLYQTESTNNYTLTFTQLKEKLGEQNIAALRAAYDKTLPPAAAAAAAAAPAAFLYGNIPPISAEAKNLYKKMLKTILNSTYRQGIKGATDAEKDAALDTFTKQIMIDILVNIGLNSDPEVLQYFLEQGRLGGGGLEGGFLGFGKKTPLTSNTPLPSPLTEAQIKEREQLFIKNVKIVYEIINALSQNFTNFFFLYERLQPTADPNTQNFPLVNKFIQDFTLYLDAAIPNLADWKTNSLNGGKARMFADKNPNAPYVKAHYNADYDPQQLAIQTKGVAPGPAFGAPAGIPAAQPTNGTRKGGKRRTLKRA